MKPTLTVSNERVDDVPLLMAQLQRMGIQELLDQNFPTHGNWHGLSLGWLCEVWLSYILSQADHRLCHVQPWAEKRLETLSICTGQSIRALDLTDDRLESVLRYLSNDESWQKFESDLGGHLLQVYDFKAERIRLDSTTASGYYGVNELGLFQFGHSKDRRPDLAQIKVMLATLDPLGMPVATDVLAGNKADDPLYCPAINRVRKTLNRSGLLYIGDCKMAAIQTRGFIAAKNDYYLCPLSATQLPIPVLESYLALVGETLQQFTPIYYKYSDGETRKIAEGFEREIILTTQVDEKDRTWTERQLIVRSIAAATAAEISLRDRLKKAQVELSKLTQTRQGKKRIDSLGLMQSAAENIIQQYSVQGLLQLNYEVSVKKSLKRGYRCRPTQVVEESSVGLNVAINEEALKQKINGLGWRVYVTNQPESQFSLTEAVVAYRQEYLIERGFSRLKGYPLSLTPIYLQREDYITGLLRLLSIGMRVLTLLEFDARRRLAEQNEKLSGLYAGNPKRSTVRPTSEQLLAAFKEITLVLIDVAGQTYAHLTPLSFLQQKILQLLDFSIEIYTRIGPEFAEPP